MESLGTQCTHVASSLEVHIPAGQIGATSCAAAVTKKRRPCRAHSERLPKTGPAPTRALHPDFDSYQLSSYRRRRSFHLETKVEAQFCCPRLWPPYRCRWPDFDRPGSSELGIAPNQLETTAGSAGGSAWVRWFLSTVDIPAKFACLGPHTCMLTFCSHSTAGTLPRCHHRVLRRI